jgi:hypothetical protein
MMIQHILFLDCSLIEHIIGLQDLLEHNLRFVESLSMHHFSVFVVLLILCGS